MPGRSIKSKKTKSSWRIRSYAVLVIALGLIAYAGMGLWQNYRTTHNPQPTIAKAVITHSTNDPDETPPTDACSSYKASNQYPERISLPTIGVSGCIERVGIDQHGAIAVPTNIYTAAWYVRSVLPGQQGVSVIDGHSGGRYANGIFRHLDKLATGDIFTVIMGSGKKLDYQVYKVQSVPLKKSVEVLLTKDPNISQLNLITCSGQYDKTSGLYDKRIIVSAKLVSSSI